MTSGTRTEEDDHRSWSVVRKPDGTYWQVASMDFFPRSGGTLEVETGEPIVDAKALAYCELSYAQWLEKSAEQAFGIESGVIEAKAPARSRIRVSAGDHVGFLR